MMMMGMRTVLSLLCCLRGTMKLQMATWKKKKHHDDDGGEGCPVSAVVSQGNYEGTNGHLEKKRNTMMMMGMRTVLSLQCCLRGTMKLQMATWKKKKHHDDDGREGCPVSAVVSQENYEVTNGHLEKKTP